MLRGGEDVGHEISSLSFFEDEDVCKFTQWVMKSFLRKSLFEDEDVLKIRF